MSKTNCVNCGAAKDTDEIRCPFCGTTYLDFTAIDFTKHDPVVCQFVLPFSDRTVMSIVAMPILEDFSMTNDDYLEVTTLQDAYRSFIPTVPKINVGISFKPLTQKDGTVFKLRKETGE